MHDIVLIELYVCVCVCVCVRVVYWPVVKRLPRRIPRVPLHLSNQRAVERHRSVAMHEVLGNDGRAARHLLFVPAQ